METHAPELLYKIAHGERLPLVASRGDTTRRVRGAKERGMEGSNIKSNLCSCTRAKRLAYLVASISNSLRPLYLILR